MKLKIKFSHQTVVNLLFEMFPSNVQQMRLGIYFQHSEQLNHVEHPRRTLEDIVDSVLWNYQLLPKQNRLLMR